MRHGTSTRPRIEIAAMPSKKKLAGTSHLNRQDLRRTAVIRLAEAGCTIPEITAITGHTPASANSILQTYLVTTYEMADAAITILEQSQDRRRERLQHQS
jgi:hypothetical protein